MHMEAHLHTRLGTAQFLTHLVWLLLSRDTHTALGGLVSGTKTSSKWQRVAGTGGGSPSPLLSRLPGTLHEAVGVGAMSPSLGRGPF